jgi:hypothetical protein
MFKVGDNVLKAVGSDRLGVIEKAWKPGSRVLKGGLVHKSAQYLVNWGNITCYEDHDSLISCPPGITRESARRYPSS